VRGNLITPRRLAIAGVCLLSFALCLGLAWWQWERFESATGTWQNLGYVLQWPLFGLFPAFLFWRMRKLRQQQTGAPEPPRRGAPEARPAVTRAAQQDEPDDELAAYNRFLAELNARDQQERR
jgi:DNA-binding transcriptional regulator of glucitol operon